MTLYGLILSGFAALVHPGSVAKAPAAAVKPPATKPAAAAKPAPTPPATPAPAKVQPPDAKVMDVVSKLQAFYQTTQSIRGEFRQIFTSSLYQEDTPHDGKFWIKKPGKLYWQYDKPDKKYFISNGKDFWLYEPKNTQAFHQPLAGQNLPVAVSFLFGQGTLSADFVITDGSKDPKAKYGDSGDHLLKLVPKKPQASYKYLYLVVDPKDFHVKETIITEAGGDVNEIKFITVESNPKKFIDDKQFNFSPPKGVRIIEQAAAPAPGTTTMAPSLPLPPGKVTAPPTGKVTGPAGTKVAPQKPGDDTP